ncbi:MAG: hypothetical protein ACE5WD_03355 [Candidatus Aminicenantia bacterium]
MRKKLFIWLIVSFILILAQNLSAKGKWEFGVHYSTWSIDILRSMVENIAGEGIENELKDQILEDHPDLIEVSYSQDINFDSTGNNYGFEVRFYPGGEKGSFSLGFSIEKTKMELSLDGKVKDEFENGSYVDLEAEGKFLMEPLSYNLSFRWDIKPSWRVRPYITFGFGIAPISGNLSYSAIGQFFNAEESKLESETHSEEKDLKDLKEGPPIIPIIQLNLGIKGEITKGLYLLIDAGIWNGFLLRGGIAYRI